ncbi:unnamed protein product [Gulo gulo]|uniref:Uncharacterized protein n=1 Tax=Gulo gulo TaxID=48420 RepID=A0A9X9PYX0_GULGU|nr:unnamed protein product [Gulo gulo]
MGLGGSGEGGDSGRGSGFFRGSRERPPRRTAPPGAARRPATKTRVAAPVSLLRRPRRRLQPSPPPLLEDGKDAGGLLSVGARTDPSSPPR